MDVKSTSSEENYLKAIYLLSEGKELRISTTSLAKYLKTSAASVTDMVQKLYRKGFVAYQKYQGVELVEKGKKSALQILRKHLLWEVFLVDKLQFEWSVIHEVAEQLEHINSDILIDRLDRFLGHPYCSPHGIVIPRADGSIASQTRLLLTDLAEGLVGVVSAIKNDTPPFLEYLEKRNIRLGTKIRIAEKIYFDASLDVIIDNQYKINISKKISDYILVSL